MVRRKNPAALKKNGRSLKKKEKERKADSEFKSRSLKEPAKEQQGFLHTLSCNDCSKQTVVSGCLCSEWNSHEVMNVVCSADAVR